MSEAILMQESERAVVPVTEEKKYIMRRVSAGDVAPMATIISKIGIKEFSECFKDRQVQNAIKEDGVNAEEIGVDIFLDIAGIIISNIPKCIEDIFVWLADLTAQDIKDIKALDIDVLVEMIIELCQKEEFKKVFKVASKLLK